MKTPDFMFVNDSEITIARERYFNREIVFPDLAIRVAKLGEPNTVTIAGMEVPLFVSEVALVKRLISVDYMFEGIRYTMHQDGDHDFVIQLMHLKLSDEVQVHFIYENEGEVVDSKIIRVPQISTVLMTELVRIILAEF